MNVRGLWERGRGGGEIGRGDLALRTWSLLRNCIEASFLLISVGMPVSFFFSPLKSASVSIGSSWMTDERCFFCFSLPSSFRLIIIASCTGRARHFTYRMEERAGTTLGKAGQLTLSCGDARARALASAGVGSWMLGPPSDLLWSRENFSTYALRMSSASWRVRSWFGSAPTLLKTSCVKVEDLYRVSTTSPSALGLASCSGAIQQQTLCS